MIEFDGIGFFDCSEKHEFKNACEDADCLNTYRRLFDSDHPDAFKNKSDFKAVKAILPDNETVVVYSFEDRYSLVSDLNEALYRRGFDFETTPLYDYLESIMGGE